MSNTIRPKVSEAIKQIASSDASGKSNSKIDTQKEYDKLSDYLSGNYDELNDTERNTITRLLEQAKNIMKKFSSTNDDDTVTGKQATGEESGGAYDLTNPNGNKVTVTEKQATGEESDGAYDLTNPNDDTVTEKYATGEESGGDYDLTNPNGDTVTEKEDQETNINNVTEDNANKMPGKKVMYKGKLCIEMPNGIYDMNGKRIK